MYPKQTQVGAKMVVVAVVAVVAAVTVVIAVEIVVEAAVEAVVTSVVAEAAAMTAVVESNTGVAYLMAVDVGKFRTDASEPVKDVVVKH